MWIHLLTLELIYGAGGAGGASGTLATTNANDTSAAAGTTTVSGTLARTNANDTSAASGSPVVNGSLAYTNANDTSAASGSAGSPVGTVSYTNNNDTSNAQGETPRQNLGAPGGARPWIAYINGKRVSGSLWELQRLIEELAEDQAEAAAEKGEEPKKPRIVVQPGKAIANIPEITQAQGKQIQADIRSSYNEAYIKAKLKFAEHEAEEEMLMLLL